MKNLTLILSTIDWVVISLYLITGLLLLVTNRNKSRAFVKYLGSFCINLGLNYITPVLLANEMLHVVGTWGVIALITVTALLPFHFYLWSDSMFRHETKITLEHKFFLLPVLVFPIYLIFQGERPELETLVEGIQNFSSPGLMLVVAANQVFSFINLVIIVKGFSLLKKELSIIYPNSSTIKWMKTWGVAILLSCLVVHVPLVMNFKKEYMLFVPLLMIHFFVSILVSLVRFPDLFHDFQLSYQSAKDKKENTVNIEDLKNQAVALDELMIKEALYLLPEIDAKHVANALDIKLYILSSILKQVKGVNFNQYVNKFRVEHAIKNIKAGEAVNTTMEGIGQEVGFKSKSAFYQAFKKETNQTPSSYIKSL